MSLMSELPISKSSTKHTDDFIRVATLKELTSALARPFMRRRETATLKAPSDVWHPLFDESIAKIREACGEKERASVEFTNGKRRGLVPRCEGPNAAVNTLQVVAQPPRLWVGFRPAAVR
jgi:hypothetical protein